jgi:hypothetical protein
MPPIAQFEDEQTLIKQTSAPMQAFHGMSGWLVKKGLAANQTSADLTLVVLAVLCLLGGGFFFYRALSSGSATLSRDELQGYIRQMNAPKSGNPDASGYIPTYPQNGF